MNYLAHARLSFDDSEILTGNLISDFVKGKKKFDYPLRIRAGITLHRAIDEFTDAHPSTAAAKSFFRPTYRLYAGALVDIVYDHFLANDPVEFSAETLAAFAGQTYRQLETQQVFFPDKFRRLFPYMRSQNWLLNYRYREGIFSSFAGLARRASKMPDPSAAALILDKHYTDLEDCYTRFFPALKKFALDLFEGLLNNR